MYYAISARLILDTAADFRRKLTDGTIEAQKPDGREIVASMNRAVIDQDGLVKWSEVCYCPSPLEHERKNGLRPSLHGHGNRRGRGACQLRGRILHEVPGAWHRMNSQGFLMNGNCRRCHDLRFAGGVPTHENETSRSKLRSSGTSRWRLKSGSPLLLWFHD